ncbi:RNA binding [Mactra antiquata]
MGGAKFKAFTVLVGKNTVSASCVRFSEAENMANTWEEVGQAKQESRRELVLQGAKISKKIDQNGLDKGIYQLTNLNYLEVSGTSLSTVESDVGLLTNLTSLVLCNNQITEIPSTIGNLIKLKILNLSNNKLETIPNEIGTLSELDTLNLSMNHLTTLPAVNNLKCLHVLNLSNNNLSALPEGVFDCELVHLSQILADVNIISELSEEVNELPHLNTLDLSSNKLTEVPTSLSLCPKLKVLILKSNKFKDRRFGKMVEQCQTKSVLEYLHNIWKKESQKSGKGKEKEKKRKKKKKKGDEDEIAKDKIIVIPYPKDDTGIQIQVTSAVLNVRQYIVCCIVRDLDLSLKFKEFITLQTKLHDTICQKRQVATIATHNLQSVKNPLRYDAMFPELLQIVPLFKHKEVSGQKLVDDLRKEADELRKEKKRNTFSGIHKYLDLLQDKTQYPCLIDKDSTVISFPPITNSDKTKISKETTDILIEVTSSTSLDICKKIMDEVLLKMLSSGICSKITAKVAGAEAKGSNSDSDSDEVVFENATGDLNIKTLTVEQVKVIDSESTLKVLYPSRTDLDNDTVTVVRD